MSPSKFHLVLIVASNFQASLKLSCDYAALWHDIVILSLWFPGDNGFEVSYSSQVNVPALTTNSIWCAVNSVIAVNIRVIFSVS